MSDTMPEPDALLQELREAGAGDDAIAEVLDAAFYWPNIVPGPAGHVVEAVDGPAWRFAIQGLRNLGRRIKSWNDPKRREEARERRASNKVKRQARRGR